MLVRCKKVLMATVSAAAVLSMTLTSAGSAWAAGRTAAYDEKSGNLVLGINDSICIDFETTPDTNLVSDPTIVSESEINASDSTSESNEANTNKVWKIARTGEDEQGEIWGNVFPESFLKDLPTERKGTLTYQFDVKFPKDAVKVNEYSYEKFYTTFFDHEAKPVVAYFAPDLVEVNGTAYTVNENEKFNYTVKEVFDYTAKTVTVLVNDRQMGTPINIANESGIITRDPSKRFVFRGYVHKEFKFYVDNFSVTYNEENEYSPYSKYYFEDFEDDQYDTNTLTKWDGGISQVESTSVAGRENVLKYGHETQTGVLNLDVSNWTEQKNRKRGKLTYKFDAYGDSCVNFYSTAISNVDDASLINAPGVNNKWGTCWIEFDYKNNKVRKYVQHNGKGIETIDMTDTFRSDNYWKMYFRRWQSIGYVDNVEISYLEDLPEITEVTGAKTENSVSATADFDVYAYKDAANMTLVAIYEDQKLIAVTTVNANEIADNNKVTCTLNNYTVDNNKTYTARAMFWDMSASKQLPLCDTKTAEITAADITVGE